MSLEKDLDKYIDENMSEELIDYYGIDEPMWAWKSHPYDSMTMAKDILQFIDLKDTLLDKKNRKRERKNGEI